MGPGGSSNRTAFRHTAVTRPGCRRGLRRKWPATGAAAGSSDHPARCPCLKPETPPIHSTPPAPAVDAPPPLSQNHHCPPAPSPGLTSAASEDHCRVTSDVSITPRTPFPRTAQLLGLFRPPYPSPGLPGAPTPHCRWALEGRALSAQGAGVLHFVGGNLGPCEATPTRLALSLGTRGTGHRKATAGLHPRAPFFPKVPRC